MTGLPDRPSRQPHEDRKANQAGEYAGIRSLYAARIAAAWLFAPRHELMAVIVALRNEESAALAALKDRRSSPRPARKPSIPRPPRTVRRAGRRRRACPRP